MADIVNRVVSSSVALDRSFWRGREQRRKGEKENRAEGLASEEPVTTPETIAGGTAPENAETNKGKHLDVSV
jgi:hypothetical protein